MTHTTKKPDTIGVGYFSWLVAATFDRQDKRLQEIWNQLYPGSGLTRSVLVIDDLLSKSSTRTVSHEVILQFPSTGAFAIMPGASADHYDMLVADPSLKAPDTLLPVSHWSASS